MAEPSISTTKREHVTSAQNVSHESIFTRVHVRLYTLMLCLFFAFSKFDNCCVWRADILSHVDIFVFFFISCTHAKVWRNSYDLFLDVCMYHWQRHRVSGANRESFMLLFSIILYTPKIQSFQSWWLLLATTKWDAYNTLYWCMRNNVCFGLGDGVLSQIRPVQWLKYVRSVCSLISEEREISLQTC